MILSKYSYILVYIYSFQSYILEMKYVFTHSSHYLMIIGSRHIKKEKMIIASRRCFLLYIHVATTSILYGKKESNQN